jgi:hypothetical protein
MFIAILLKHCVCFAIISAMDYKRGTLSFPLSSDEEDDPLPAKLAVRNSIEPTEEASLITELAAVDGKLFEIRLQPPTTRPAGAPWQTTEAALPVVASSSLRLQSAFGASGASSSSVAIAECVGASGVSSSSSGGHQDAAVRRVLEYRKCLSLVAPLTSKRRKQEQPADIPWNIPDVPSEPQQSAAPEQLPQPPEQLPQQQHLPVQQPQIGSIRCLEPSMIIPSWKLAGITEDDRIQIRLCRFASANMPTHDEALEHALGIVSRLMIAAGTVYVGISKDPRVRFDLAPWSHTHNGYTNMIVMAVVANEEESKKLEMDILHEVFGRFPCANQSRGGENAVPASPHFVYVVYNQLWRSRGTSGTGRGRGRGRELENTVSDDIALFLGRRRR